MQSMPILKRLCWTLWLIYLYRGLIHSASNQSLSLPVIEFNQFNGHRPLKQRERPPQISDTKKTMLTRDNLRAWVALSIYLRRILIPQMLSKPVKAYQGGFHLLSRQMPESEGDRGSVTHLFQIKSKKIIIYYNIRIIIIKWRGKARK